MRKTLYTIASLALAFVMLTSCHNELEADIAELQSRVSEIEELVSSLNSSCKALSELVNAIDNNDHIKDIQDNGDGTYKITFVSGNSIDLRSGADGEKPVIGVKYDEDAGNYYWTIQQGEKGTVQWLYDSTGKRVRANSITPRFKVENNTWYYTFSDAAYQSETGWSVLASPTVGEDGSAIFKSVVPSKDGMYLTIELVDGTVFQIVTQKLYDTYTAKCDTINANIAAYKEIIQSVDSNIFVVSVTKIDDDSGTGYDILLESGKTLTIRDGKDCDEFVYLAAKLDLADWEEYWAYSLTKDGDRNFIYYEDQKLPIAADNDIPIFGFTDSAGVMNFTVSYGLGSPEMLRDSLGNAVRAYPVKFFDSVTAAGDTIKLKLTSFNGEEGKTVNLCRAFDWTPVLYLKDTKTGADAGKVAADEQRQLLAYVDSIPARVASFSYDLTAVALDSAYVVSVENPGTKITGRAAGAKQGYTHKVTFKTSADAAAGSKVRVAVFLTWDDSHTIMKVSEFEVK